MHILEVDTAGKTVADLGPPVPDSAPPCGPGTIAITTLRPAARPSLEVEAEVHAHLAPRIEAHLRRIMAWDTRTMSPALQAVLAAAIENVRNGFAALGEELTSLGKTSFVAKTTASSRKRAALKCAVGRAVQLTDEWHDKLEGLFYSAEELATLTLSKVGESSVLVVTAGGREIGPLPFAHVELVDG